jgi:hypothetical protein
MRQDSAERWLPVVGFETHYEISSEGRVRSIPRLVPGGTKGRVLKQRMGSGSLRHPYVTLSRNGKPTTKRIHHMVAEAFIGPRPSGLDVLHWDDVPTNNRLSNLRYGDPSENAYDCIRNGNNHYSNIKHCPAGHAYTEENTRWCMRVDGRRFRRCRTCYR